MVSVLTYSRTTALLLVATALVGAHCGRTSERVRLLRGVSTVPLRFEFTRTGVPALSMDVLRGLDGESVPEARYDMFYIYRPSDTGTVQRGMVMLESHPDPRTYIPDSVVVARSPGVVAGEDVEWRFGTTESEGKTVYQRELRRPGFFARGDAHKNLFLHVFVVGYDSAFVDTLMASVESLRFAPDSSSAR
jgi:hypothetical protein